MIKCKLNRGANIRDLGWRANEKNKGGAPQYETSRVETIGVVAGGRRIRART